MTLVHLQVAVVQLQKLADPGDIASAMDVSPGHRLIEVTCCVPGGSHLAGVEAIGMLMPLDVHCRHKPASPAAKGPAVCREARLHAAASCGAAKRMTSKASVSLSSKLVSGKGLQVACLHTVASSSPAHRIQCILHLSLQVPEQTVWFPLLFRFSNSRLRSQHSIRLCTKQRTPE